MNDKIRVVVGVYGSGHKMGCLGYRSLVGIMCIAWLGLALAFGDVFGVYSIIYIGLVFGRLRFRNRKDGWANILGSKKGKWKPMFQCDKETS